MQNYKINYEANNPSVISAISSLPKPSRYILVVSVLAWCKPAETTSILFVLLNKVIAEAVAGEVSGKVRQTLREFHNLRHLLKVLVKLFPFFCNMVI